MSRANTRVVKIGDRVIGGGNPILIQSMTNTKTEDVEATVKQIQALTEAGCDIIRCAVPTMEAAKALSEIKKQISEDPKGNPPAVLCVLCGMANAAYQRPDGVFVVPITALKY